MVTRDDYGRNHFDRHPVDRRLCESEVETPTGYRRVCAVASPDGDEAVVMASDCRLASYEGDPAYGDGWPTSGRRVGAGIARVLTRQTCRRNRTT